MHNINRHTDAEVIDLSNFSDCRLSSEGWLEFIPEFKNPIVIIIGGICLELTMLSTDSSGLDLSITEANKIYIVQNVDTPSKPAITVLGGLEQVNDERVNDNFQLYQGRQLTIGTKTTPELKLPDNVLSEHLVLRVGAIQGYLHLAGIGPTQVLFEGEDSNLITSPTRYFKRDFTKSPTDPDFLRTLEYINGAWSGREDWDNI